MSKKDSITKTATRKPRVDMQEIARSINAFANSDVPEFITDAIVDALCAAADRFGLEPPPLGDEKKDLAWTKKVISKAGMLFSLRGLEDAEPQNEELARLLDETCELVKLDDDSPNYIKEAKEIIRFLSDGDVGGTRTFCEGILSMAVRAHVELSPEVAAILYLSSVRMSWNFHNVNTDRDTSPFEVDSLLSLTHARVPVLDELERYRRIKISRRREKGGAR